MADLKRRTLQLSSGKQIKLFGLEGLGIVNTQYVVVKHTDRAHLHLCHPAGFGSCRDASTGAIFLDTGIIEAR